VKHNIINFDFGGGAAESTLERKGEHGYDEHGFLHVDHAALTTMRIRMI